jgi:ribose transport system substrate-binding protein
MTILRGWVDLEVLLVAAPFCWCRLSDYATLPFPRPPSAWLKDAGSYIQGGVDMSEEKTALPHSRRDFFRTAAASAGAATALLGGLSLSPALAATAVGRSDKPLKAAFSNAGLQATWCAQGKQAAEYWGKLFNVEVTWFDGELDAVKQRAAIDNMASQKWDFVAIQAFGIGTLTAPVQKMIDAGIPVIDMDTLIAPLDQIKVHSFLAPDNEFMGASVTQALVSALGGKGKMIMTQGALGHTGAQGRAKGFETVVKQYPNIEVLDTQPADWSVSKTAQLWETYLTKYPQIDAAFFHNDDMALAAYNVMKAHNRTNILIGGVDAMPPAIQAVLDGRMYATVRNPSCRIHGGAIIAGVAAVNGEKTDEGIPKNIVTDGPVVTKANAPGMQWMEDHFLI